MFDMTWDIFNILITKSCLTVEDTCTFTTIKFALTFKLRETNYFGLFKGLNRDFSNSENITQKILYTHKSVVFDIVTQRETNKLILTR